MHVCVAAYEKVRAAQKYHGTETEVFYFPGLVLWSVRENNYFVFFVRTVHVRGMRTGQAADR